MFSKMFSDLLGGIFGSIAAFFGLASVEELMFNAGTRGATHYFGTMPSHAFIMSLSLCLLHLLSI